MVMHQDKLRIIVSPLDWGLGHATRCIPVIRELISNGAEVIIAAEGSCMHLLKKEFPGLPFIFLHGYRIRYSKIFSPGISLALRSPSILRRIYLEHQQLKKIIAEWKPDAIISDNRFGLWNKKAHSVFITHQVSIRCPRGFRFFEPLINLINRYFINRYDECWIPDDERNLAGGLSQPGKISATIRPLGILSAWEIPSAASQVKYDYMGIVSGPEPQRSEFEKKLVDEFLSTGKKAIILSAKPQEENSRRSIGNVELVSHMEPGKIGETALAAGQLICRAGYSTIMDLVSIGKSAILIPTPGQSEQLYLAQQLHKKKFFYSVSQEKFKLAEAIDKSIGFSIDKRDKGTDLTDAIRE